MKSSQALCYRNYGRPEEVLVIDPLPLPPIGANQVLIKMLAAPVNPSDFGIILGSYGRPKPPPAVAGREGVGEVVEVGTAVAEIRPGQRVRFPAEAGTWQERCVVDADTLILLPEGLPLEMAAMAFINPPTAWRLLHDFVELTAGEWIIQNAANSAVGLCVIQLAQKLGLKTVNVVRRRELEAPLREMGADVVVTEEEDYVKAINELTGGRPLRLGLNTVGGMSAVKLIKALSDSATLVTFGAMTFEAVRFPTRQLIFHDVRLRGFWLDQWLHTHSRGEVQALFETVFTLIVEKALHIPVAKEYPLSEYKRALKYAAQPRLGKVLFRGRENA